jgi:hypothetical protein
LIDADDLNRNIVLNFSITRLSASMLVNRACAGHGLG